MKQNHAQRIKIWLKEFVGSGDYEKLYLSHEVQVYQLTTNITKSVFRLPKDDFLGTYLIWAIDRGFPECNQSTFWMVLSRIMQLQMTRGTEDKNGIRHKFYVLLKPEEMQEIVKRI